jgi:hypothetical protein
MFQSTISDFSGIATDLGLDHTLLLLSGIGMIEFTRNSTTKSRRPSPLSIRVIEKRNRYQAKTDLETRTADNACNDLFSTWHFHGFSLTNILDAKSKGRE